MKKVIEKYSKGIFVFVLLNCFALVVNVMNVDTHYSTNDGKGRTCNYYFTNYNGGVNEVWPFVTYRYMLNEGFSSEISGFNGLFYNYDFREFLLYIGLLFVLVVYKAYIATPKVKVPSV